MVTTATACAALCWVTSATTLLALATTIPGLAGSMWRMPSAIRFRNTKAAATKMPKVTRAFSRIPRMLRPATAQMTARTTVRSVSAPRGRNAVPLITALTVEMQAVRM